MHRISIDSGNTDAVSSMKPHISRFSKSASLYSRRSCSRSNRLQPPRTASSTVTIWRHCPSAQRRPACRLAWLTSTWTCWSFLRPRLNSAPDQNGYASCARLDGVEKYVWRHFAWMAMPEATLRSS
ncbi:hypothetical protein D3C81_1818150 [compost metagenome]